MNASGVDIIDPGTRLGYGKENSVPGLLFEGRLGLRLMQNSFDGSKRGCAPRNRSLFTTSIPAGKDLAGARDRAGIF
jgi:hypothetical protein